ncbi:MAG: bacillithiol system redox-active protein YtxJ [Bacteroidetes bacterium]|nr:bacillithiol system redox-active protein YtxJ [Bacteroidota bacterium]
MNWITLTEEAQLQDILEKSTHNPVVIYKHSTRCGTSDLVKMRLERSEQPENIDFYYLDLIRYRDISNRIAEMFDVYHESPQVLLIKNGECIYDESHHGIYMQDIIEQAA